MLIEKGGDGGRYEEYWGTELVLHHARAGIPGAACSMPPAAEPLHVVSTHLFTSYPHYPQLISPIHINL